MDSPILRSSPRCSYFIAAVMILVAASLAAETVSYTYDAAGRLLRADYGAGKTASFTYDKAGNILAATTESPDHTLRLALSPTTGGSVTGPGISCPGSCVHAFSATQTLTLTALPASGLKLLAWWGDLASTSNPFTFDLDRDQNLTAYFGSASGSTDSDGIPDSGEMGPDGTDPSHDGNSDGVPDYQQANVASFPTALGGGYATLEVPPGMQLADVRAISNPHPEDAPSLKFPYGFFSFTVTGVPAYGCVVALHLPRNTAIAGYYKYGPTPENQAPHWYQFARSGATGADIVQTATSTRVLLHFVDAQRGDDVLTPDGMIVDVGGPSALAAPVLDLDVRSVDFGTTPIGSPASRTVTIANTGDADLVIGTLGQGNGLAAPFSITADTCSGRTLQPQPTGDTCTVMVRFLPTTTGTFNDSFAIPSNDPANNPATVSVSGQGDRVEPIPVLDTRGLALLIAALLGIGVAALRRRA